MWSPIPYNASLVDRVDILVSPRHSKHVKQYLSCAGMNVDVIEENLQKAIDEENDIDDQEVISKKASKIIIIYFSYSFKWYGFIMNNDFFLLILSAFFLKKSIYLQYFL